MSAPATDLRARARELWEQLDPEFRDRFTPDLIGELSSDGWRYLAIADGRGAPVPYHYRWLLPRLLGEDRRKWGLSTWASLAALPFAMRAYTGNWVSGVLLLTLPGVTMQRRYPTLVDAQAMLLAVSTAAAVKHGQWGLAAVLSLAAGATKESAPIFAAAYAWHPLPLVGLAAFAARARQEPGEDFIEDFSHECLTNPWRSAWRVHGPTLTEPKTWLAPWGALLAGFRWDPQTVVTLALGYGQCTRAVDRARLFQWAGPVVARNVTRDLPRWSWLPAALATAFNPWRGNGG